MSYFEGPLDRTLVVIYSLGDAFELLGLFLEDFVQNMSIQKVAFYNILPLESCKMAS